MPSASRDVTDVSLEPASAFESGPAEPPDVLWLGSMELTDKPLELHVTGTTLLSVSAFDDGIDSSAAAQPA